jgi:hypothetical protein
MKIWRSKSVSSPVEPSALAAGSQARSLDTGAGGLHASQCLLQPRFIQRTQQLD